MYRSSNLYDYRNGIYVSNNDNGRYDKLCKWRWLWGCNLPIAVQVLELRRDYVRLMRGYELRRNDNTCSVENMYR
jgi:hypothetical protein